MIDHLKFDFCDIEIYDGYMIVTINEGVTLLPKHNNVLINVADTYYHKKDFIYITHRIKSYSVDPSIYIQTSKISNLKAMVVVSKDFKAKANVEVEMLFCSKPYKVCNAIEDAVAWAKIMLNSTDFIEAK